MVQPDYVRACWLRSIPICFHAWRTGLASSPRTELDDSVIRAIAAPRQQKLNQGAVYTDYGGQIDKTLPNVVTASRGRCGDGGGCRGVLPGDGRHASGFAHGVVTAQDGAGDLHSARAGDRHLRPEDRGDRQRDPVRPVLRGFLVPIGKVGRLHDPRTRSMAGDGATTVR